MKIQNLLKSIIVSTFLILFAFNGFAQISVSATAGTTGPTPYTTLKNSFDAINSGLHQGVISINVIANSTETISAVLNASGSGLSSYSSITIQPSGGNMTIAGSVAGALISFNGADNVTIDGLNSGGNNLTIENTSTSTTATAITFNNDATTNTITNCSVKGSTGGLTTIDQNTRGVIFFGNTAPVTGNDNNTLSYCNIGPSGSNLPWATIYSYGSSTAGRENSGNAVLNCNLVDYFFDFSSGSSSNNFDAGIYLGYYGNTAWTISNNSFYQTASRNKANNNMGNNISAIYIACGDGYTISENHIGGTAPMAGGAAMTYTGNAYQLIPIKIRGGNIASVSNFNIINNKIKNIGFSSGNTNNSTNNSVPRFSAIHFGQGKLVLTGNEIGSKTTTSDIVLTQTNTTFTLYDLLVPAAYSNYTVEVFKCNSNSISGVSMSATNFDAKGMHFESYTGNRLDSLSYNIVGSLTTQNSIQIALSTASVTRNTFQGIFVSSIANGSRIISNNTIKNISRGTGSTDWISGLYLFTDNVFVTKNIVQNIHSGNNSEMHGIYAGGSSSSIRNNFISRIGSSGSTSSQVIGIVQEGSTGSEIINNIVSLGVDKDGVTYATRPFVGIRARYACTVYFNTVYIDGNNTSASNSFAYYDYFNSSTRNLRNNIFANLRNNTSGSAKNYAAYYYGTGGLTSNFNDYFAPNTGGIIGYLGADRTTLAAFQGATLQDGNSVNANPQFSSPGGIAIFDHFSNAALTGTDATGVSVDISNQFRNSPPKLGAIETIALPVALSEFRGALLSKQVNLYWKTSSEINNSHFEIERSAEGTIFNKIGQIAGAGNSTTIKQYGFDDLNPLPGKNYYRLKQVDLAGKISYSTILFFNSRPGNKINIYTYPNPVVNRVTIRYGHQESREFNLFNGEGRQVMRIPFPARTQSKEVDLSNLPPGIYMLKSNMADATQIIKK